MNHSPGDSGILSAEVAGSKFKSVRRALRMLDLIGMRGEELTAKELAREVGTNLSSCYYLLNLLAEEEYIEKIPRCGGYRIGPAITVLEEGRSSGFDYKVEPVLEELARWSQRQAHAGVLSDGELEVVQVKVPPGSPPVGLVKGFHGASHALALGKVLLAGMGADYVDDYIDKRGLEIFTLRTIVQPAQLHAHLNKVRMVGIAMDFEEFSQNLCCVAAPVESERGKVEGAIGISTVAWRMRGEGHRLVEMVRWAAEESSALLRK